MPRQSQSFKYSGHRGSPTGTPTPPAGPQFYAYRSDLGTADGLSAANACQVSSVWAKVALVATQSPVVNLVGTDAATDGHYTGANAMITPPAGLAGVAGAPITVQAINDGGVWIDGQGARTPVVIDGPTNRNDYFTLQGFDASGGDGTVPGGGHAVISISANYVTFKRVIAYDADSQQNEHVWSISGNTAYGTANATNILIEDCGGFGTGRKAIEFFDTAGPNTLRRFWGRWEKSICSGPKASIQVQYNSKNLTVDNGIFRVYDLLPASYVLTQNDGSQAPYPAVTSCNQGTANTPVGFCTYPGAAGVGSIINETQSYIADSNYLGGPNVDGNCVLSGLLILQLNGEPVAMLAGSPPSRGIIRALHWGNQRWQDIFVYWGPGVVDKWRGDTSCFGGFCLDATATDGIHTASQCYLTNATSIAPNSASDSISGKYTVANRIAGTNLATAGLVVDTGAPGQETLYRGSRGAKIRYRYQNGGLTGTALWPWPMSARIKAATTRASTDGHGHTIEDVDATVQATFGNYP